MRYLFGLLALSACSGDPGTVTLTAEPTTAPPPVLPAPIVTASAAPAPEPVPEEPPLLGAPLDPPACLPGYHEPPSGACCLIDVIPAGSCKCAVYSGGKLVAPGDMCFDSCKFGENGVPEYHAFCVDGGLTADRQL